MLNHETCWPSAFILCCVFINFHQWDCILGSIAHTKHLSTTLSFEHIGQLAEGTVNRSAARFLRQSLFIRYTYTIYTHHRTHTHAERYIIKASSKRQKPKTNVAEPIFYATLKIMNNITSKYIISRLTT